MLTQLDSFYEKQETPRYTLYQVKFEGKNVRDLAFRSYDELQKDSLAVDAANYSCVYSGRLTEGQTLDGLYEKFNLRRPTDFLGHSLSVSDVIVTNRDGQKQAFYVDSFGFKEVPEFFASNEPEKALEQSTNRPNLREVEGSQRKSVLSRLQEKKNEAAKINQQRQKPEKAKGLDR